MSVKWLPLYTHLKCLEYGVSDGVIASHSYRPAPVADDPLEGGADVSAGVMDVKHVQRHIAQIRHIDGLVRGGTLR